MESFIALQNNKNNAWIRFQRNEFTLDWFELGMNIVLSVVKMKPRTAYCITFPHSLLSLWKLLLAYWINVMRQITSPKKQSSDAPRLGAGKFSMFSFLSSLFNFSKVFLNLALFHEMNQIHRKNSFEGITSNAYMLPQFLLFLDCLVLD